jgi:hypothetical protein
MTPWLGVAQEMRTVWQFICEHRRRGLEVEMRNPLLVAGVFAPHFWCRTSRAVSASRPHKNWRYRFGEPSDALGAVSTTAADHREVSEDAHLSFISH